MSHRHERPPHRRSISSFLGGIAIDVVSELTKTSEHANRYSDEDSEYDDDERQRNRGGQGYDEEDGYFEGYRPEIPRSSRYMTKEEEEGYQRAREHFGSRKAKADPIADRLHPDYVGRGRGNIQESQSSEVRHNSRANSRLGRSEWRRENSTERGYRSRSRRPSSAEPQEATSGVSVYSTHHRRREGKEGFCVVELGGEHPKENLTCSFATDDSGNRTWMCTTVSFLMT